MLRPQKRPYGSHSVSFATGGEFGSCEAHLALATERPAGPFLRGLPPLATQLQVALPGESVWGSKHKGGVHVEDLIVSFV